MTKPKDIRLYAEDVCWGGTIEEALKHFGTEQTDKTIMTKQITLSDIHSFIQGVRDHSKEYLIFTNGGVWFHAMPIDKTSDGLNGYISYGIKCDSTKADIKQAWFAKAINGDWSITEYDVGAVIKDGDYSIITAKPKASATFWNVAEDNVTMSQKDIEEFGDAFKYGIDWCKQLQSSGRAKLEKRKKEYEHVGWIRADGRALGEEYDPFKRFLYDFSKL